MCYGGLDPKYAMRDVDARMKPLSCDRGAANEAAPAAGAGLIARLRAVWTKIRQKELRHV